MKTLLIFALLIAAHCAAADALNLTNKIVNINRDKDGQTDIRYEITYRGTNKVMVTQSRRNEQGSLVVASRSCFAGNTLVMTEADEDHDGKFESVAVLDSESGDMEMFTRQPDGSLKPVPSQVMDLTRQQISVADESLRKIIGHPEISEEELGKTLEANRRKIEKLEQEKKKAHQD